MLFARPVLLFVSLCLIIVLSFRFVVRFFFKSRLLTNLTNLFNSFLVPYFRHIFVRMNLFSPFSDAYTHLYIRVCLSIGPSVGCASFLTAELVPKSDLTSINAPAQRSQLLAGLSALFFYFPICLSSVLSFGLFIFLSLSLSLDS